MSAGCPGRSLARLTGESVRYSTRNLRNDPGNMRHSSVVNTRAALKFPAPISLQGKCQGSMTWRFGPAEFLGVIDRKRAVSVAQRSLSESAPDQLWPLRVHSPHAPAVALHDQPVAVVNPERAGRRSGRLRWQARFDEDAVRPWTEDRRFRLRQWLRGINFTVHRKISRSGVAVNRGILL